MPRSRATRPNPAGLIRERFAEIDRLAVVAELEHATAAVLGVAFVDSIQEWQLEPSTAADLARGEREQHARKDGPELHGRWLQVALISRKLRSHSRSYVHRIGPTR